LQAAEGNKSMEQLLSILQQTVPSFADQLREDQL
jgi:hypothetical protein